MRQLLISEKISKRMKDNSYDSFISRKNFEGRILNLKDKIENEQ